MGLGRSLKVGLAAALSLLGVASNVSASDIDAPYIMTVRRWIAAIWQGFTTWVFEGYAAAPVLMASLGLLALVPPLAVIGYFVHRLAQSHGAPEPEPMQTVDANIRGPSWPQDAWITVENGPCGSLPVKRRIPRELLSVGRADDNDLVLIDPTVHGHHAVINRSEDARIVIRDLSGAAGNGVKINGARVVQAALRDGDRIEIGKVVLMYEGRPL